MTKVEFAEKIKKNEIFFNLDSSDMETVVEAGFSIMNRELERLLEENFPYSPNQPCLRVDYLHIEKDGSVYEVIYGVDIVKKSHEPKSKVPLTYMVGFTDKMLAAVATDLKQVEPLEIFHTFVKSYQNQSDDEYIDMPMEEIATLLDKGSCEKPGIVAFIGSTVINMPDYSDKPYTSEEIQGKIKDYQGSALLTAPNINSETILHANAFMDNLINRSARATSKSIADIGMMKEQAISYGIKAASSKVMEIQIQSSPLSNMAGMF
ncbi:hypothetical protein [Providencia manganoxydans]|uniref:hypothetical protein n=1 Tax=Providencia manganoxydans TaxID=2923283 RepID=UPI0034DCCE20